MQFMGNVNSRVTNTIILVLSIFYLAYLTYDYSAQSNESKELFGLRKASLVGDQHISALLLGGSNVVYSLSASRLTDVSDDLWFNFGLASEAQSDENYWEFVENSISKSARLSINTLVYSSLQPLRTGSIEARSKIRDMDSWGNQPIGLVPQISLAIRLRNALKRESNAREYPLPLESGDFNFSSMNCPQNYEDGYDRETDASSLSNWMKSQLLTIRELFPNAKIAFVVPSEFYGILNNDERSRLANEVLAEVVVNESDKNIWFYAQPAYPTKEITCDLRHHANEIGREWRTVDLIGFMNREQLI